MKQRSNYKSCCFNNRSSKIQYERLEQTSGIQGSSFALVCAEPEVAGSDSFHWPGLACEWQDIPALLGWPGRNNGPVSSHFVAEKYKTNLKEKPD